MPRALPQFSINFAKFKIHNEKNTEPDPKVVNIETLKNEDATNRHVTKFNLRSGPQLSLNLLRRA